MLTSTARESGMGLPHSKTLARFLACHFFRQVVECGRPMPLFPFCHSRPYIP
jgi:hypothetical protein